MRAKLQVHVDMEIETSFPEPVQLERIRTALEGLFFDVKIVNLSIERAPQPKKN